jgi:hypothetical protein
MERVLERWRIPVPKTNVIGVMRLVRDLSVMLRTLYFPSRRPKPVSNSRENEVFDLSYKIEAGLTYIDHARWFLVLMAALRGTAKHDIARIPFGPGWWAAGSAVFSCTGMSFKIANRCLEYSRRAESSGDIIANVPIECFTTCNRHCQGAWDEIEKVDHHLIDQGLRCGDLWHTVTYMWFHGVVKAEQGEFFESGEVIERLFQIGETYDHAQATFYAHSLKADHLIKKLSAHEALVESEEGISYCREQGTELVEMMYLGYKAEAQLLLLDAVGSHETITKAYAIYEKQKFVAPLFGAPYLVARFSGDIHRLEQEILAKTPSNDRNILRNAYRSGKAALRNARKYAPYRTKTFRLMGLYYWLMGKQRKAFRWWDKSMKEGERLGARPDLSRTYFEVGKHLLEPHSKYQQLNGIDANGYLEKAEKLFREMELEHDLDELERVRLEM